MKLHRLTVVCAVAAALALGACEGIREQLGLTKQPPDEFRVQARAPLSMPPDFFRTPPPQPGSARPQEGTVQQQARDSVFRADQPGRARSAPQPGGARSAGERALLAAAGADKNEPNIRKVVDGETSRFNEEDKRFLDYLVFWRDAPPAGVVVDADQEARRLRENAALGRPATEGRTPTIERKRKALLEGIF